ncbi:MAG: type II secretion system F family protein [Phycisphaeraceae bacterium]|nr:type II secretion system F family protein [Phycisphaeraceae bacterium]
MPTFQYEALNEAGKPQKATITANNSEDAIAKIRAQGLFPTAVREQKVKKGKPGSSTIAASAGGKGDWKNISINIGGVGQKALTTFTRQMSTLQDAGLPILRSLAILEQQQKPGLFKNIINGVHEDVSGGSTLSDAMAKHPKAFDKLYTKMIAAGEVGGVLDVILQRLAEFMEKAAKLKKRIIGAMIYPAVVLSVAALIVLGIMILIVPKFEKIFDDFNTTLPTMTMFLINSSKWIGGRLYPDQMIPGIVWIIFSPIVVWLGLKFARKTAGGKAVIDAATLKIPVAGKLIAKSTIARFTRTLGTLISAGVPILDAISITKDTTGNHVYASALGKVYDSVRQGESFAEPLRQARVTDAIVVNMIDVGEETGDLDKMLTKIADNYDEEVDVMVASLISLLEPIMVVVLGGIVGFIVIALFLPLVKLIQTLT